MFAQVTNAEITTISGRLPKAARRLDTGQWVMPPNGEWTTADAEACGWFPVIDTARPADDDVNTHDRTIELVAGQPTVVWTQRAKTVAELDAAAYTANDATVRQQATAALTTNRDYLAAGTPTNAQVVAQVRSLTQQNVKLIRLALGLLEGTD